MGYYKADIRDVEFNLTELLKIQDWKDYGLEEQDIKGILTEYNKFVENEVFPTREPSDQIGVKHIDGKVIVPEVLRGVQKSFYDNGWFALGLPESVGGTAVPEALYVARMSLATGANCAWTMYPGLSRAALNVINLKGDEFMKTAIVPKMMSGEWGGTMCLTEAGAGSDVGALRTTARRSLMENTRFKERRFSSLLVSLIFMKTIFTWFLLALQVEWKDQRGFPYSLFLALRSILMDQWGLQTM